MIHFFWARRASNPWSPEDKAQNCERVGRLRHNPEKPLISPDPPHLRKKLDILQIKTF